LTAQKTTKVRSPGLLVELFEIISIWTQLSSPPSITWIMENMVWEKSKKKWKKEEIFFST